MVAVVLSHLRPELPPPIALDHITDNTLYFSFQENISFDKKIFKKQFTSYCFSLELQRAIHRVRPEKIKEELLIAAHCNVDSGFP
ncbi:MAG: hypothetical protein QME75_14655 [Deltaproteobacteria bacterium]|nr:hypothetical protein [Desulfitobacteriaceae bacterium]MDI6854830.1 hypothetical protein [Deltaproteobacteria bacterium]